MLETEPIEKDVSAPDIEQTAKFFQGPLGIRSLALTGLLLLACFYTIYFARDFLLPIALALVLSFLLQPMVRTLKKGHIPEGLGAALVILFCFAVLGFLGYELAGPVVDWAHRLPEIEGKFQSEAKTLRKPVEQVTKATEQVQKITTLGANAAAPSGKTPQQVELKKPNLAQEMLTRSWAVLFEFAETVILLYFLLAAGDLFLRKLIHVLPTLQDKKKAVQIAREVEGNISLYLFTVAMINLGLGTAATCAFWLLGMPNPALWGALGCVLNFIPFLGASIEILIVAVVATATFPSFGHALLVPGSYLLLAVIEGNFITPYIIGRRLTLNPVVILIALTFWGWLWGIPGALMAVPMVVMLKIFCDHIEPLAAIGEFLGGETKKVALD